MTPLKLSTILCFISILSCNTAKTPSQTNTSLSDTEKTTEDNLNGYISGKLYHSKASTCDFVLIDLNTEERLDPTNLDPKNFSFKKEDTLLVNFKYRRLRMPPRCIHQPVEIEAIKKRLSKK